MADISVMKKSLEYIDEGKELAIATIVKSKGSTPRREGAKILVLSHGKTYGTIGGGKLEKKVIDICREAIKKGKTYSIELPLDGEELQMTCGGEVEVFIEVYKKNQKILIIGGGHVGYAVYQLANLLNFDTVIFEDRKEILSKERFPLANELVLGNIEDKLKQYPIDNNTYIVIVTRGHNYDEIALETVIESSAKYIGVMGSRQKVSSMMDSLKEKGIKEEIINKVYSPIGIKISDGTPQSIALSIIAEIELIRNNGMLSHMKDC